MTSPSLRPLSNHPGYDGTVAKLTARATAPSVANPFVSGQPVVERAMRVLNTCARAQKARFLLTAEGGADGVAYASAAGALHRASQHEDAVDVAAAGLQCEDSTGVVPVAFPYSAHAGDHAGLCAHGEP